MHFGFTVKNYTYPALNAFWLHTWKMPFSSIKCILALHLKTTLLQHYMHFASPSPHVPFNIHPASSVLLYTDSVLVLFKFLFVQLHHTLTLMAPLKNLSRGWQQPPIFHWDEPKESSIKLQLQHILRLQWNSEFMHSVKWVVNQWLQCVLDVHWLLPFILSNRASCKRMWTLHLWARLLNLSIQVQQTCSKK